jgi:hypothetical protein
MEFKRPQGWKPDQTLLAKVKEAMTDGLKARIDQLKVKEKSKAKSKGKEAANLAGSGPLVAMLAVLSSATGTSATGSSVTGYGPPAAMMAVLASVTSSGPLAAGPLAAEATAPAALAILATYLVTNQVLDA